MIKIITILFCVFTICSAGLQELLLSAIFKKNDFPIRVRTVEELNRRKHNESVVLDFVGLVEQYDGYKAKEYNVTTEDGYILGLHRIYATPTSPEAKGKPAILMQHGLFGSSDFLIVMGPEQALAYQLADAGYDVWLGNVRGNYYSRSHVKYQANESKFWDFRMDEMGQYDLSTFIDFILKETDQEKLTYIGYSMGTTISYMLLSVKPEYNDKINLLVSLAPVAYFSLPPNSQISRLISIVLRTAAFTNRDEIFPQSSAVKSYAEESCSSSNSSSLFNPCKLFLSSFVNTQNMDISKIPLILSHAPGGTSYYTVEHYQQLLFADKKFLKYNYRCSFFYPSCLNKVVYNQTTPPEYDVSLITVPNVIFYSLHDIFAKVEDTKFLKEKLSNVVAFEEVPDELFNHLDFIWSIKARESYSNRLLQIINDNVKTKT